MARVVRVLAVLLVAAVLLPAVAGACPLCKEATSDADMPGGGASLGVGFYYSILLMISAPFLAVGTLAFLILRSRRRARAALPNPARGVLVASREARP
jgi:hypothetical protein